MQKPPELLSPVSETTGWIDEQLAACSLPDQRLRQRWQQLLPQLSGGLGESIPFACQDGAHTKAAYRFLSNPRVSEEAILTGRFQATQTRFAVTDSTVLILQDTTEFTFARKNPAALGAVHLSRLGRPPKDGRKRHHPVCGILLHSSLAVTTDGLPLGWAAIKFWSRSECKGTNALQRKINPTRVPMEEKESFRWLENVRQSTARWGQPPRCVPSGERASDI